MTVGELKNILKNISDDTRVVNWDSGYEITDVFQCNTEDYKEERTFFDAYENKIKGNIFCL